jgi:hypothetical protein
MKEIFVIQDNKTKEYYTKSSSYYRDRQFNMDIKEAHKFESYEDAYNELVMSTKIYDDSVVELIFEDRLVRIVLMYDFT